MLVDVHNMRSGCAHLLLVHEIEFYANRLLIEFTRAIEDLKYRHACSD